MPKDVYGNYTPGLESAGLIASSGLGFVGYGQGAPDASTPTWYEFYIDRDTGSVYGNQDGTSGGWFLVTASISGVTGVYGGTGNPPAGVSGPAIFVQRTAGGAPTGSVWIKGSAGVDSQWSQILAA